MLKGDTVGAVKELKVVARLNKVEYPMKVRLFFRIFTTSSFLYHNFQNALIILTIYYRNLNPQQRLSKRALLKI